MRTPMYAASNLFLSNTFLTTMHRLSPFHSDREILFVFRSSTIRTAPAAAPAAGMFDITTCQSASYSHSPKCFPALLFFVAPPLLVRIRWHTCRRFFILLDSTGAGQHYRRPDEFAPMDVAGWNPLDWERHNILQSGVLRHDHSEYFQQQVDPCAHFRHAGYR